MISTATTLILPVMALAFKVSLGGDKYVFAELDVIRSKPLCRGDKDKIAEMQSNWGIVIMVMFEKNCVAKQLSHVVIWRLSAFTLLAPRLRCGSFADWLSAVLIRTGGARGTLFLAPPPLQILWSFLVSYLHKLKLNNARCIPRSTLGKQRQLTSNIARHSNKVHKASHLTKPQQPSSRLGATPDSQSEGEIGPPDMPFLIHGKIPAKKTHQQSLLAKSKWAPPLRVHCLASRHTLEVIKLGSVTLHVEWKATSCRSINKHNIHHIH